LPTPRLSIVIPALGSFNALEATLVSVLQNRPTHCEVVVALDRPYADPYQLADEVRFVVVREARSVAEVLDGVVKFCRGAVLHVLTPGVEVEDGWTDAPLEHFFDDRIAAVAPLVLERRDEAVVCAAGVDYSCGGKRWLAGHGDPADAYDEPIDVLGPTALAAFYQRDALLKLPHAFAAAVTDRWFDVDLALQLKTAGYRAVVEPRSVVYREAAVVPQVSAFATGRGAERLFWRNAPTLGLVRSVLMHPFTIARDLIAAGTAGEKAAAVVGRLTALLDVVAYRRHRSQLRALGTPGLSYVVSTTGDKIRLDGAHPHPAGSSKPTVPVEGRDGREGRDTREI